MKRATPSGLSVAAAVLFLVSYVPPALAQIPIPKFKVGKSDVKKVAESGPKIAAAFSLSDFTFDALVDGGWPLYFDYELEQPGLVRLTINVKKVGSVPFVFKRGAGRHEELVRIPASLASRPAVASYSIKAVSDDTPGATPISIDINALAVGKAVGSSGLTQLRFSPREVRTVKGLPADSASYSFRSIRHFSGGARAEIRLWSGGRSKVVGSKSFDRAIAPGETVSGTWDCKKGGKPSLGRHKLLVRAWFTLQDSGAWNIAQSRESVMISP